MHKWSICQLNLGNRGRSSPVIGKGAGAKERFTRSNLLGAASGKARQGAQVKPAPGIGCLAKDGEIADCSKDPAVVKQAVKLIEKSPHPNAAVRLIQRSKGRKQQSRKRSRGRSTKLAKRVKDLERKLKQRSRKRCRGRSTKLAKRVKDLERKLKTKTIELAKMQVAAKTFKKKKRTRKQSASTKPLSHRRKGP